MQRKEARHKLEGNRKGDNHNEKVVLQLVVVHLVVFLLVAVHQVAFHLVAVHLVAFHLVAVRLVVFPSVAVHLVVFHSVVIVEVKQYKELALVLVLWLV